MVDPLRLQRRMTTRRFGGSCLICAVPLRKSMPVFVWSTSAWPGRAYSHVGCTPGRPRRGDLACPVCLGPVVERAGRWETRRSGSLRRVPGPLVCSNRCERKVG